MTEAFDYKVIQLLNVLLYPHTYIMAGVSTCFEIHGCLAASRWCSSFMNALILEYAMPFRLVCWCNIFVVGILLKLPSNDIVVVRYSPNNSDFSVHQDMTICRSIAVNTFSESFSFGLSIIYRTQIRCFSMYLIISILCYFLNSGKFS